MLTEWLEEISKSVTSAKWKPVGRAREGNVVATEEDHALYFNPPIPEEANERLRRVAKFDTDRKKAPFSSS